MSTHGCPHRIEAAVERRPANALNIEIGSPSPRCKLKKPDHWPENSTAERWLWSGGSSFVFGLCSADCPLTSTVPSHQEKTV
jgi:hypothetical protein